jgi:hypothetical protein
MRAPAPALGRVAVHRFCESVEHQVGRRPDEHVIAARRFDLLDRRMARQLGGWHLHGELEALVVPPVLERVTAGEAQIRKHSIEPIRLGRDQIDVGWRSLLPLRERRPPRPRPPLSRCRRDARGRQ